MPDFSMCPSASCKVRRLCKRHEDSGTIPNDYQTYSAFTPTGDNGCGSFWDITQMERATIRKKKS